MEQIRPEVGADAGDRGGGRLSPEVAGPGGNRRNKVCPHADPSKPGPRPPLPFTPFSRSFERLWEGSGASS